MTRSEFDRKYTSQLNPQQLAAVHAVDGAVLLLAVPGSGKGHLDGRVVDLHEGQRLDLRGGAQGVADGDIGQAGEGDNITGGDVVARLAAVGLEVVHQSA